MKLKDWFVLLLDCILYLFFLWDLTQQEILDLHGMVSESELRYFVFGLSIAITIYCSIQIGRYYKEMEYVWEYIFWNERLFAILVILRLALSITPGLAVVLFVEIALAGISIFFHRNKQERNFKYFLEFIIFIAIVLGLILIFSWYFEIIEIYVILLDWSMYFFIGYIIVFLIMLINIKIKRTKKIPSEE